MYKLILVALGAITIAVWVKDWQLAPNPDKSATVTSQASDPAELGSPEARFLSEPAMPPVDPPARETLTREEISYASNELQAALPGAAISVEQAARLVADQRGRPTMVMIFSSHCPRSTRIFPDFVRLAERERYRVDTLAFTRDEVDELDAFLFRFHPQFELYSVQPSQPGEYSRAMSRVGVHFGRVIRLPLIAVLDAGGRPMAKWEAVSDIRPIERAIAHAAG